MKLLNFNVKRYKGYIRETCFELAPLTILVGENGSGKSSLARAIHLFASSILCSDDHNTEPLTLSSDGITHGRRFNDLVSGHSTHGQLFLSAEFKHLEKKPLYP